MRLALTRLASRLPRRGPSRRELMARMARVERDLAILMSRHESDKLPRDVDERFAALARDARRFRRSMLTKGRLLTLWEAVQSVAELDGAAAEVGTYQGGSARFIATAFEATLGHEVPLEVIDTFEGHPQDRLSQYDSAMHMNPSLFTDTSYDDVVKYLSPWQLITVHKGDFSKVAPHLQEQSYRLVHVDVDLYEPTLDCLRYFGHRLVPGGVIIIDDYGSPSCPGVDRAVAEYLAAEPAFRRWGPRAKQLVIERRANISVAA